MTGLHGVGGRAVIVESEHRLGHRVATGARASRILRAVLLVLALAAPAYAQAPNPPHTTANSTTCASCHADVFVAFQRSAHSRQRGGAGAPTCMTCHGTTAARLSLMNGEANPCATCHGPGNVAPRSEYVTHVRLMGALIELDREKLADASQIISGIRDIDRRIVRLHAYDHADRLLHEAAVLWHSFTFEDVEAPLGAAGQAITALLDELAEAGR